MAVVGDRVGGRIHLGEQGKLRRLAISQIGELETQTVPHRIALDAHLVLEVFVFGRLLGAGAAAIELPAVVEATNAVVFDQPRNSCVCRCGQVS